MVDRATAIATWRAAQGEADAFRRDHEIMTAPTETVAHETLALWGDLQAKASRLYSLIPRPRQGRRSQATTQP